MLGGDIVKLIIFGIGKIYKSYRSCICPNDVIAFTDNQTEMDSFEGKPVIAPSQIKEWEFDYIVIFTSKYFDQIFHQLTNDVSVNESKIISYLEFVEQGENIKFKKCRLYMEQMLQKMHWKSILDIEAFLANIYFSKEAISLQMGYTVKMDAVIVNENKKEIFPIYNNLYDHIYVGNDNTIVPGYHCLLGVYLTQHNDYKSIKKWIIELAPNVNQLFLIMPVLIENEEFCSFILELQSIGRIIYKEVKEFGNCFIFDFNRNNEKENIKIYSVGHTSFRLPPNSLYQYMYVGNYGKEFAFANSDSRGENIAVYNEAINETTALYWIWKNAKENYVGICHYRRYFAQSSLSNDASTVLQEATAKIILNDFDIILPNPVILPPSLKIQLLNSVDEKSFEEGWKVITQLIKKKQPEYWEAFEYVFNGIIMYPCNMFVTKKEIIDTYCEWLFSFIIDAVEAIDISKFDAYSKRIIGFFIERLFTVWLVKQHLKIKELPIIVRDTNNDN